MTYKSSGPADAAVTRILNCLPSPDQADDWTFGAAVLAGVAATGLPDAVDLRDDSWWPIGNQGQTGSCVGWATADGLLRYHFSTAGWIAKGDELSVRFTWMASKETDEFTQAPTTFIEPEGTSLKAALDVSRRYGAVLAADLPFGGALFPGPAKVFYTKAARLKIASYANLGPSLIAWRRWLAGNGPILVRLNVDATWANAWGRPSLDRYHPETAGGGHAVALVGYTEEGFIVRNSWGKDWGENGYAIASDAYAAAAFTEAYGAELGGREQVAAGIAPVRPAEADAPRPYSDASWGNRAAAVEAVMLEVAQRTRGQPFGPLSLVSSAFGDLASFAVFLTAAEAALEADGTLTSAPPATLEHLRQGFFDELADWAWLRLPHEDAAAPAAGPAAAAKVPATIVRNPASTLVMIKGVTVPPGVSNVSLDPGRNSLRVKHRGAPGSSGTGKVLVNGVIVASATADIPPGMPDPYEAYSGEVYFNV